MSSELVKRLDRIEESFEFQDNTIETLSEVLIAQQKQIDKLEESIEKLQQALSTANSEPGDQTPEPPPPHY